MGTNEKTKTLREAHIIMVKPGQEEEFFATFSNDKAMKNAQIWKKKHGHQIKRGYGRNPDRRVKYD